MTLDEAIKHCEEVASECEFDTDWGMGNHFIDRSGVADVIECAEEHRQLAEWLKELEKDREILTRLDAMIDCYENCERCQGFREYPTSQFVKDVIRINKEVNADEDSD